MRVVGTILLLFNTDFVTFVIVGRINFDFGGLFDRTVTMRPGNISVVGPNKLIGSPVSTLSLKLKLVFNATNLPRVLVHFFAIDSTHRTHGDIFCTAKFVNCFCVLAFVVNFNTVVLINTGPRCGSTTNRLVNNGGVTTIRLTGTINNGLFLNFVSTITFTAVLTIITNLALTNTSTISRSLCTGIFGGNTARHRRLQMSGVAMLVLNIVTVVLNILFRGRGVTFVIKLTFTVTTDYGFPVVLLSVC